MLQGLTLNNPSELDNSDFENNSHFDIEAGRKRVLTAYKRKKLLEDGRNSVEKYIDVFWRKEIILKKVLEQSDQTQKIRKAVEKLISNLLYMSDEADFSLDGNDTKYTAENLLHHQEEVLAIVEAMNERRWCSYCFPYEKDYVKSYFVRITEEQLDAEE